MDQCFAGATALCTLINRDAAGNLTSFRSAPINCSQMETSGIDIDIEASYRLPIADWIGRWRGQTTLRAVGRALLATGRQPPLGEKPGIHLIEADYGHAIFEATPDGSSYNPMGSVHGGYIAAILDSACGIAAHSALKTVRAARSGRRVACDLDGRAAFSEAVLQNDKGQVCATATSTLLVFPLPTQP